MKTNILVIVLLVVFFIAGFLLGVDRAVFIIQKPLLTEVKGIRDSIRQIESNQSAKTSDVSGQLAGIYQRLSAVESKVNTSLVILNDKLVNIRPQAPAVLSDLDKVYDIPAGISPVLGNKEAAVTITEFADFQCPFCARFYPPALEVLKAYPDKVRLVVKNFPLSFHPNARPAAKLALAANEQGKYYEMVQVLLDNGGAKSDDKIKEYAKKLGLNYKKLMDDYKNKDGVWEKQIADDESLANQVGVQGTPTFYLNGRQTQARDLNAYKTQIDKILSGQK